MTTEYEPMKQARETFRIAWYRCPIEKARLKGGILKFGYFHVADFPGRHEPGTGPADWVSLLRLIRQHGGMQAIWALNIFHFMILMNHYTRSNAFGAL